MLGILGNMLELAKRRSRQCSNLRLETLHLRTYSAAPSRINEGISRCVSHDPHVTASSIQKLGKKQEVLILIQSRYHCLCSCIHCVLGNCQNFVSFRAEVWGFTNFSLVNQYHRQKRKERKLSWSEKIYIDCFDLFLLVKVQQNGHRNDVALISSAKCFLFSRWTYEATVQCFYCLGNCLFGIS